MIERTVEEEKLVSELHEKRASGDVAISTLSTDDRVLARITDGIYRQPASALRELLSNAYDADATLVTIHTDAPRFERISISDNGNGMDVEALARLIHHIGGSTKRRSDGVSIGVTSEEDPTLSPNGRKLIGKIGIGLFAVAQLTRHFQIITKVAGNDYRLIAEVILKTYAEDTIPSSKSGESAFESGIVRIASVPAEDKDAHGTDIVLLDIRTPAKELLRSKDIWELVARAEQEGAEKALQVRAPAFHIGEFDEKSNKLIRDFALPWSREDNSAERFRQLYQAIINEIGASESNPSLENSLDNYLQMLWTLSLSAPIDYVEEHPFDLGSEDQYDLFFYKLVDKQGQAERILPSDGSRIRDIVGLQAPERGPSQERFDVIVDEVLLKRPIRFHGLPMTSHSLKRPIVFYGKAAPNLAGISEEERGGEFSFEAYFLWSPKVVPKENNGLLIRISDASGTLFDESFAKYQVSELNRLKQITAEVFVIKGLDASLNIDRESFNTAHPHYQILQRWVHRMLRQIMTTLKQLASMARQDTISQDTIESIRAVQAAAKVEVESLQGEEQQEVIDVRFLSNPEELKQARNEGALALDDRAIFTQIRQRSGKKAVAEEALFRERIAAVAKILSAYGLLEDLSYEDQQKLLRAIVRVFVAGGSA